MHLPQPPGPPGRGFGVPPGLPRGAQEGTCARPRSARARCSAPGARSATLSCTLPACSHACAHSHAHVGTVLVQLCLCAHPGTTACAYPHAHRCANRHGCRIWFEQPHAEASAAPNTATSTQGPTGEGPPHPVPTLTPWGGSPPHPDPFPRGLRVLCRGDVGAVRGLRTPLQAAGSPSAGLGPCPLPAPPVYSLGDNIFMPR